MLTDHNLTYDSIEDYYDIFENLYIFSLSQHSQNNTIVYYICNNIPVIYKIMKIKIRNFPIYLYNFTF